MRYLIGGMCGGIAGAVTGAVLSFGMVMLYLWVGQPDGNMASSMRAAGVGNFYLTVALPIAVVLGIATGVTAAMLILFVRDSTRD